MRRSLVLALVAAVFGAVSPARAVGPDVWDVAREPRVEADEKVFVAATAMVRQALAARGHSSIIVHDFASAARSMLDEIHAAEHPDVRFRFLLGQALHILDDDSRTIAVLEPATEMAPDHPDLDSALFDLAVAYARADRPRDEIRTYDRALEVVIHPEIRHTVLSNRAEAKAKLFDFPGAIADYRASIELLPDRPLPRWGLAVTLDRTGDFARAIEEAVVADEQDRGVVSMLDTPAVFFVPDYDRDWYHAVREVAKARATARAIDKKSHWEMAALHYASFAAHSPKTERWAPLARSRVKLCLARANALSAEARREASLRRPPAQLGSD